MSKEFIPVYKIPFGKSAVVRELKGDISFIAKLRELGFGESATITKFSEDASRTIIVSVKNQKIYLSAPAAECIFVELV
jgi:hypothetical protein